MREREGLIARIRQIRRASAPVDPTSGRTVVNPQERLEALEARIAHLERLVEGLQDSVHRESERHGKLIAELQARVQPSEMGAALARHARDRGL
jgi:uncharacterized coiled-coil protein SlyX